jgi:hypothetical protein
VTEQAKSEGKRQGVKREDPPGRPVDGLEERGELKNADPNKHYVLVGLSSDFTINPAHYQQLGYKFSTFDPDEVQPQVGWNEFKQGDRMIMNGVALMECSAQRKAELDAESAAWAKQKQDIIQHKDEHLDPREFRGITSMREPGIDDRASSSWASGNDLVGAEYRRQGSF